MKTISLKISETLNQRITREAARRKISKSALACEAIEHHLSGNPAPGRQASFLQLAGDLVGRRRGPGDLSTNPEYMKSFGK